MRKINTDHTYEYNDVTGYVTNCFGDDMRGTDDHIDELNLLMGEIRALTEKRDRLAEALKEYREALSNGPENCSYKMYEAVDEFAEKALAAVKGGSHE